MKRRMLRLWGGLISRRLARFDPIRADRTHLPVGHAASDSSEAAVFRDYMMFSYGEGVGYFDTEAQARAALREEYEADPVSADTLLIIAFNETGHPVGDAITVRDLL